MMETIRFLENGEGNCLTLINKPTGIRRLMITSEAMCVDPNQKNTVHGEASEAHQSSPEVTQAQLTGLQDKLSQVIVPEEPASSSHSASEAT